MSIHVIVDVNQIQKVVDLVLADRAYYDPSNIASYEESAALHLESEIHKMINTLIASQGQYAISKYGVTVVKEWGSDDSTFEVFRMDVLYNPSSWDVQYETYYYDMSKKQVILN